MAGGPNVGFSASGGSIYDQSFAGFWARSETAIADNNSRSTLASRSRVLEISSPVASALIGRLVEGVIGSGLQYMPMPQSDYFARYKDLTDIVKRRLLMASNMHLFDDRGMWTLSELQEAAFYNMVLSGDVFLIRVQRKDGMSAWRLKEEFCCQTPEFAQNTSISPAVCRLDNGHYVVDGVELSKKHLAPIAYWFTDQPFGATKKFYRVPAHDRHGLPIVLHAKLVRRADQYRGVPLLAPVIESVWSTAAYSKAETQAAIIEACMVFAVTTNAYNKTLDPLSAIPGMALDSKIVPDPPSEDFSLDPFGMRTNYLAGAVNAGNYISPGQSVHLSPGEDIKSIDTKRPNSGFQTFLDSMIMLCGASLGIPKQILTQSFDGTYSSSKAATVQFNRTVSRYRKPFVEGVLKPMFEQFCYDLLMALGASGVHRPVIESAKLLSLESVWRSGEPPMVLDPTKELDYYLKACAAGLISRDEVAQMLFGHDAVKDDSEMSNEEREEV